MSAMTGLIIGLVLFFVASGYFGLRNHPDRKRLWRTAAIVAAGLALFAYGLDRYDHMQDVWRAERLAEAAKHPMDPQTRQFFDDTLLYTECGISRPGWPQVEQPTPLPAWCPKNI